MRGCQSQVWLVAEPEPGGRIHLRADSDAVLVKGLISLLLRLYDRRTPEEIMANPPEVLERVGLSRSCSRPGRSNGLYAMVARIRGIAKRWRRRGQPKAPAGRPAADPPQAGAERDCRAGGFGQDSRAR